LAWSTAGCRLNSAPMLESLAAVLLIFTFWDTSADGVASAVVAGVLLAEVWEERLVATEAAPFPV